VSVLADDDVVVDFDAEAARNLDYPFRHFNIGARRCRVASGMVVQESV
jgi:hypothetical protein